MVDPTFGTASALIFVSTLLAIAASGGLPPGG
jgi:hypothetical protein